VNGLWDVHVNSVDEECVIGMRVRGKSRDDGVVAAESIASREVDGDGTSRSRASVRQRPRDRTSWIAGDPNLALAKDLLDRGEVGVVLEYFQLCRAFVTKNPKLDDWVALLKGGRVPDLSGEYLWFQ
jgi:hypothetical protein